MKKKNAATLCPCGSGHSGTDCCLPLLSGERHAASAEALMRSRYTAFALGNAGYLLQSWHPSRRPARLDLQENPPPKWIGLHIDRHERQDESHAIVEFTARCRIGGRAACVHETSRFVRENDRWYYVDGDIHQN